MADLVKKLKSQIGDDVCEIYSHEALFSEAAAEITRLRVALAEKMVVKVKPLVWEPCEDWKVCSKERAPAFGGEYQMVLLDPKDDPRPSLYFEIGLGAFMFRFEQGEPDHLGPTGPKKFPTFAAAKAAAQADYTARILSAVDPDEITRLRAALADAQARSYTLAVAIMGGEDAPGLADATDAESLADQLGKERAARDGWTDACVKAATADAQAVGFAAGVEAAKSFLLDAREISDDDEEVSPSGETFLTLIASLPTAIRALTPPDATAAAARVLLDVWPTDASFDAAFNACAASYHGGDQMQDVMDRTRATVFAALRAIAGDTP